MICCEKIVIILLTQHFSNDNFQLLGKTFLWKMIKLLQNIYGMMCQLMKLLYFNNIINDFLNSFLAISDTLVFNIYVVLLKFIRENYNLPTCGLARN